MLRIVKMNKRLIHVALFPFAGLHNSNDDPVRDEKLKEITTTRVIIDKLKDFFYDKDGHYTKEVQSVINLTTASFVAGFIIGGINRAKLVPETFLEQEQATVFRNKFDMHKHLQYKTTMAIFKGGIPFAMKVATFCFMFSSISVCLHKYKGKFDVSNYVISGMTTGFIYKLNMGLKGACAGALLGSILGSISGTITLLLLNVTGIEMDQVYTASHEWTKTRRDLLKKRKHYLHEEEKQMKEMYLKNQELKEVYEKKEATQ